MLAHAEIVIGAPDGDFLGSAALGCRTMAQCQRKPPRKTLQIGKDAIAPFGFQPGDRIAEMLFIVHGRIPAGVNSRRRSNVLRHAVAAKKSAVQAAFAWPRSEEHTSELQS